MLRIKFIDRLIFLLLMITSQKVTLEQTHSLFILQNKPGLSATLLSGEYCFQFDGKIPEICKTKKIQYFVSHWDREHVTKSPPKSIFCAVTPSISKEYENWNKIKPCPHSNEITVLNTDNFFGDKDKNSRVFYLNGSQILILGDLHLSESVSIKMKLNLLLKKKDHIKWVVLPQQGKSKKSDLIFIDKLNPKIGFLVNSTTRIRKKIRILLWDKIKLALGNAIHTNSKLDSHDSPFRGKNKIILDTYDWGDIVIQIP